MLSAVSRAAALYVGTLSSLALAQIAPAPITGPGPEVQRLQEQQAEQARERANARPDVFTPPAPAQAISLSALPKEAPCFQIQGITLEDNVFSWLPDLLKPVNGQCVGKQGLEAIELQANNALMCEAARISWARACSVSQGQVKLAPGFPFLPISAGSSESAETTEQQ